MREQRRAQVVEDPLPGELGEIGLGRAQRVESEEDQQEQRRDAPEPRPVAAKDVVVDRDLTAISPETIREARIMYTIVGGRIVFDRGTKP